MVAIPRHDFLSGGSSFEAPPDAAPLDADDPFAEDLYEAGSDEVAPFAAGPYEAALHSGEFKAKDIGLNVAHAAEQAYTHEKAGPALASVARFVAKLDNPKELASVLDSGWLIGGYHNGESFRRQPTFAREVFAAMKNAEAPPSYAMSAVERLAEAIVQEPTSPALTRRDLAINSRMDHWVTSLSAEDQIAVKGAVISKLAHMLTEKEAAPVGLPQKLPPAGDPNRTYR